MADPIQHAERSEAATYEAVRAYVAGVFPRIVLNYMLVIIAALILNALLTALLSNFLWPSTAAILSFMVNLGVLYYGWRWLEGRNHATALFVLYTRYSRQRRDLKTMLTQAQAGTLENTDMLYTQVDVMEEQAQSFIQAAQELGVEPRSAA